MGGLNPLLVASPEYQLRRIAFGARFHRTVQAGLFVGVCGASLMAILSRFKAQAELIATAKQLQLSQYALLGGGALGLMGLEQMRYTQLGRDGLTGPQRERMAGRLEHHLCAIHPERHEARYADMEGAIRGALGDELVRHLPQLEDLFEGPLEEEALQEAWDDGRTISVIVEQQKVQVFRLLLAYLAVASEQYLEAREQFHTALESESFWWEPRLASELSIKRAADACQRREAYVIYLLRLAADPECVEDEIRSHPDIDEDLTALLDFEVFYAYLERDLARAQESVVSRWVQEEMRQDAL